MPHLPQSHYTHPIRSITPTIDIYIKLAQYPTLAYEIRVRMREELFQRGIIDQEKFKEEVKTKALESQLREGLHDPFGQEQAHIWQSARTAFAIFRRMLILPTTSASRC